MTTTQLEQPTTTRGTNLAASPATQSRERNALHTGIALERIPMQTRTCIETLLPRGTDLLLGLCAIAVEKHYELSSLSDVAILIPAPNIHSIADLARELGWAYDTLNAFIIVLCAFGILKRCKHGRHVELWLPLNKEYTPDPDKIQEELVELFDPELGYRSRVQTLAVHALARFLALYQTAKGIGKLASRFLQVHPGITEAASLLERVLTVAGAEEISIGTLRITKGDTASPAKGRSGTLPPESPDPDQNTPRDSQNRMDRRDSGNPVARRLSTESRRARDSHRCTLQTDPQNLLPLRDSEDRSATSAPESPVNARLYHRNHRRDFPESPESCAVTDSGGDSESGELLPVTGNKYITFNKSLSSGESGTGGKAVSKEKQDSDDFARILASLLEHTEAPGAVKSYINLLEQVGEQIAAAALIATLVRKATTERMGPLTKPGGYFTQRCRRYAADGIPEEILDTLDCYRELPFSELEDRIRADVQGRPQPGRDASPSFTEIPRRGKPMTTREQAEVLMRQIASDDPSATVYPAREVLRASGVEYVVDIHVDGHPYTLTSPEDWDSHFHAVQSLLLQLEGGGGRVVPSTYAIA